MRQYNFGRSLDTIDAMLIEKAHYECDRRAMMRSDRKECCNELSEIMNSCDRKYSRKPWTELTVAEKQEIRRNSDKVAVLRSTINALDEILHPENRGRA